MKLGFVSILQMILFPSLGLAVWLKWLPVYGFTIGMVGVLVLLLSVPVVVTLLIESLSSRTTIRSKLKQYNLERIHHLLEGRDRLEDKLK